MSYDPVTEQIRIEHFLRMAGMTDIESAVIRDRDLDCLVVRGTFRIGTSAMGAFFVAPTTRSVRLFSAPDDTP